MRSGWENVSGFPSQVDDFALALETRGVDTAVRIVAFPFGGE